MSSDPEGNQSASDRADRTIGRPFWKAFAAAWRAGSELLASTPSARCTVTMYEHERVLQDAKTAQAEPAWQADYRGNTPKVERKIARCQAPSVSVMPRVSSQPRWRPGSRRPACATVAGMGWGGSFCGPACWHPRAPLGGSGRSGRLSGRGPTTDVVGVVGDTPWDMGLAEVMNTAGRAVHEEILRADLLADFRADARR